MSLRGLMNQPLTLHPKSGGGGADEYGNEIQVDGTPVQVMGRLEQTTSTERLDNRDVIVTGVRAFLPSEVTVGPLDEIEADGVTWQVVGNPVQQWNPRLRANEYQVVQLTSTQGG